MVVNTRQVSHECETYRGLAPQDTAELVHRRLAENRTYAHYFQHVSCHREDGVLVLRGQVPTDRLLQMLTQLLGDLNEAEAIENHVDVISATGLSSLHRED